MLCRLCRVMGIVLLFANGLLTACESFTPTSEPDQVTLQLNWTHEAVFAGFYVAEAHGFYRDENIAVTIHEGGAGVDVPQLLLSGTTDFAVFAFDEYRRTADSDTPPVAVMAVLQMPAHVLFTLSDSGIQNPQDMVGRRVAVKNEGWRQIIRDVLSNAGVDPAEIIEVGVEYDAIEMLYNGEVDVWTGYVHDEPAEVRLAGYDVNLIFPADYGVGAYGDLLVVRQDTLDQDPDLVARFVRASLHGWQYAVEHSDEAGEAVTRWQPDYSLEFHQLGMRALVPLIDMGQVPIGWIDAKRWQVAMGTAYDPERPGYTMQFVQVAEK